MPLHKFRNQDEYDSSVYGDYDIDEYEDARYIEGINTEFDLVTATDVGVNSLDYSDYINYGVQKNASKTHNDGCINDYDRNVNKGKTRKKNRMIINSQYFRELIQSMERGE